MGRAQIAGTSEVKAQVKLRFYNSSKEQMIVERRLQVTKKKTGGGLTMKTLEGVISFVDKDKDKKVRPLHRFCHCVGKMELIRGTWDTQKRTSLSTKCAALDEEVPKQLGVSKAILENVIFCHQEESNWPLSEPAALKKKFDDIFEATKCVFPVSRAGWQLTPTREQVHEGAGSDQDAQEGPGGRDQG